MPADARFCDDCGTPVGGSPAAPVEGSGRARKIVTVLFADLVGSTTLQEEMDPEAVRSANERAYAAMRRAVEGHGGTVVKFVGDGVMAVFGVPDVAEDDAARALAAAVELRDGFGSTMRIGVNTGEVVVAEGDDDVVGDAVNVASRLEHEAPPGGVLVGDETYRLTRDCATFEAPGSLHVKGRIAPVAARVLVALGSYGSEAPSAFVGREAELAGLVAAVGAAEATGRARLVTVVGSPGVGKSRLLGELELAVAGAATVLVGRCDAAGSATFAPVAEVLRAAVGAGGAADDLLVDDPERARVTAVVDALLGGGDPGTPQEAFWAVRRVIEATARRRPTLVVLDDLHWAEPLLLDLVEHLAEWLGDAPVLLVAAGRPELRELRPSLVEVGAVPAAVVSLEGLDASATQRLAEELLGAEGLPPEVVGRVVAATDGNPLFVRELLRMLVDDGVLRAEEWGWVLTVDADDIEVPPTISSLLAARIERLGADERTVLERASVMGQEVVRGALSELLPPASRARLGAVLESLRRKELLEPAGAYWIDEPLLRFHHVLIRDAAYRRLLKGARADLHERAARWIEVKTGDAIEHDELVGYHLEQSQANRRELGPLDDQQRTVAVEAGTRLGRAAHRALHRDDLPAAATLSGRALACLEEADDPSRTDLLLIRCEALLGTGDVASGRIAVDELDALADDDNVAAWATAFEVQLATMTGSADLEASGRLVRAAADRLAELTDPTGAAKAHRVHASVLARLGRIAETEAALDRALTAARQANDNRQISGVLAAAPLAALWGPSPVPRAGGRCLDIVRLLRITTGARAVETISTRCQAVLEAFRGRPEAARRMLASARRTLEDLGLRHGLLELELFAGIVELAAGDPAAAEERLRAAHHGLQALGVQVDAAQAAALRARAALALGNPDRALELAEAAEALGGGDLKTAIAWRSVKAEVLALRGDREHAVELARAAVALAEPTDALVDHADAVAALGVVLAAVGDEAAARAATAQACELYERKGATALAARLGGGSAPASVVTSPPVATNLAVVAERRACDDIVAGRWDEFRERMHPDFVWRDGRRGVSAGALDRDATVANARAMVDVGVSDIVVEPLVCRGDRTALLREVISGRRGFGVEFLYVLEVDERGLMLAGTTFDDGNLAAAMAELDQVTGVCANQAVQALRIASAHALAGEWDAYVSSLNPDFELEDRRPGPNARVLGRDECLASTQAAARLGLQWFDIDAVATRGEHLAIVRHRSSHGVDHGVGGDSGDGFYVESLMVTESDQVGRALRLVEFEIEDLDAAMAELDRLADATDVVSANRVAIAVRTLTEHALADRWDECAATMHPDYRLDDRRAGLTATALDRDGTIASTRAAMELGIRRVDRQVVATRGDDLALIRVHVSYAGGSYVEMLAVLQGDGSGRVLGATHFEPEHLGEALAELDQLAGKPAENLAVVVMRRANDLNVVGDWDSLADLLHPHLHYVDARRGMANEYRGRDLHIANMRALGARRIRLDVFAVRGDRAAAGRLLLSNADGSAEGEVLVVVAVDDDGLATHNLNFDVEDIELALAELDRLAVSIDALRNAATRAYFAYVSRGRRGEHDRVRVAPGFRFEDRRAGLQTVVQSDSAASVVTSELAMVIVDAGVLAVRGDRLALVWSVGTFDGTDFTREDLTVLGVDETGQANLAIAIDTDRLADAQLELDERYAADEGAHAADVVSVAAAFTHAVNTQQWSRLADVCAADLIHVDHRPASFGSSQGVEATVERLRDLAAVVPGSVGLGRRVLELRPGLMLVAVDVLQGLTLTAPTVGGLVLLVVDRGRLTRYEVFPADAEAPSRARLDELVRGDGVAALGDNAAVRTHRRWIAAFEERRWTDIVAMHADGDVFADHRSLIGGGATLGIDETIEMLRAIADVGGASVASTVVARRGGRLALTRDGYSGKSYETEVLQISEVDDRGLFTYGASFDPGDVRSAIDALEERYQATLPEAIAAAFDVQRRAVRALNDGDVEGWAALAAADFEIVDHQTPGYGTLDRAGVLEAVRAVNRPGHLFYAEDVVAVAEHGSVARIKQVEQNDAGGDVEHAFVVLSAVADGELSRCEYFDLDVGPRAIARLAELAPPASLLGVCGRALDAHNRYDMNALGALIADDCVYVDHFAVGQGTTDKAGWLAGSAARDGTDGAGVETVIEAMWPGSDAAVFRHRRTGQDRSGGRVEWVVHTLLVVRDGQIARTEVFPDDALEAALARLDALAPLVDDPLQNRAFRQLRDVVDSVAGGDLPRASALVRPDFRAEEHRVEYGAGTSGDGDEWCASLESLVARGFRKVHLTPIAVRGDSLVLAELALRQPPPDAAEPIVLYRVEVDADGRAVSLAAHDPGDLDAAVRELDERYQASLPASVRATLEVGNRALDAINRRDLDGLAAILSDGFSYIDHRSIGFGERDKDGYLATEAVTTELAATTYQVCEAVWPSDHGAVFRNRMRGEAPDGGPFELEVVGFVTVADGLVTRIEAYDEADRGRARARFAGLAPTTSTVVATAGERLVLHRLGSEGYEVVERDGAGGVTGRERFATGDVDGVLSAFVGRYAELVDDPIEAERARAMTRTFGFDIVNRQEWAAVRDRHDPAHIAIDHRSASLGVVEGRDEWVEVVRIAAEVSPDIRYRATDVLALAPGVASLSELTVDGHSVDGAEFEREFLGLFVAGPSGGVTRTEVFSTEQRDAALVRFDEVVADAAAAS